MRPTVTAIMSVFNGAPYLAAALDSMLAQLEPGDEVIIVDDGSTDDTPAILAHYGARIRVLRQDNAGSASAYNRALAEAHGELLTFNDADDLWPEHRIALQLAAFAADDALDVVFGHVRQFVSPELSPNDQQRYAPRQEILPGATFPALMGRRKVFDRLGALDAGSGSVAMVDYASRMYVAHIKTSMVPDIVLLRRLHANNFGRRQAAQRDTLLLTGLRAHLQRRRAAPESP